MAVGSGRHGESDRGRCPRVTLCHPCRTYLSSGGAHTHTSTAPACPSRPHMGPPIRASSSHPTLIPSCPAVLCCAVRCCAVLCAALRCLQRLLPAGGLHERGGLQVGCGEAAAALKLAPAAPHPPPAAYGPQLAMVASPPPASPILALPSSLPACPQWWRATASLTACSLACLWCLTLTTRRLRWATACC